MALSEIGDNSGVYVGSLDSPEVKRVLDQPTPAVYAEPGYLLYVNENDLYAQPFDLDDATTKGQGTLIARGVDYGGQYATGGFSVAQNGTLLYHRWASAPGTPIVRMSIDGTSETTLVEGVNIDLSRDGARLAFMRADAQRNSDIWTYDLRRGISSRVTFETSEENGPVWSGDGKTIANVATAATGVSIVTRPSGGGGSQQVLLTTGDSWIEVVDWSRDGKTFVAEMDRGASRLDIVTVDVASKTITPFAATPFVESSGRFSPDGRWIAYRSDESGTPEIYVQPFPATGSKWQISNGGGESPRWSGDGKRLFYVRNDAMLMSVGVKAGADDFEVGTPATHRRVDSDDIAITPDGKEVIVSKRGSRDPQPVVVVSDWRP